MKFGGTSMAGIERIRSVASRVKAEAERGNQVLVVVSAMAGETDRLVQFCREASSLYDPREYDVVVASGEQVTSGLLAITLQGMGMDARSWMGWQLLPKRCWRRAALRGLLLPVAAAPPPPPAPPLPPQAMWAACWSSQAGVRRLPSTTPSWPARRRCCAACPSSRRRCLPRAAWP